MEGRERKRGKNHSLIRNERKKYKMQMNSNYSFAEKKNLRRVKNRTECEKRKEPNEGRRSGEGVEGKMLERNLEKKNCLRQRGIIVVSPANLYTFLIVRF